MHAQECLVCLGLPLATAAKRLHSQIRKDLTTCISHQLDFRSVCPCASGLLSTSVNSENTALLPGFSALAPNPGMSSFSK